MSPRRDIIVYGWLLVATVLLAIALIKVMDVEHGLANDLASQKANRVSQVATWCQGINSTRDDQRRRVSANQRLNPELRLRPYTLPDLNCRLLERQAATAGATR